MDLKVPPLTLKKIGAAERKLEPALVKYRSWNVFLPNKHLTFWRAKAKPVIKRLLIKKQADKTHIKRKLSRILMEMILDGAVMNRLLKKALPKKRVDELVNLECVKWLNGEPFRANFTSSCGL